MTKPRRYWSGAKGQGKTVKWLRDHVGHTGDECLIWPFSRIAGGYGRLGYLGESHYAHRMMCELTHGKPPTTGHHAAHSCGSGQSGCVNPNHLSWKTISGNMLDKHQHGTMIANQHGNRTILRPQQVAAMRALKGVLPQDEIAKMFGVKRGCVQYWHRHDDDPLPPGSSRTTLYRRSVKQASFR